MKDNNTTIKKWTSDDIRKILMELDIKTGLEGAKLPIKISSRMIKTKGYFKYNKIYNTKTKKTTYVPEGFNFAKILLDGRYSEEVVRDTIIHEYSHFYCTVKYTTIVGHGIEWKRICKSLGGSGETYFKATANEEVIDKTKGTRDCYVIECLECGSKAIYLRKTEKLKKLLRNLKNFRCGKCKGKLKSYKNKI